MLGMNKLPLETRVQILSMLVEGSSMRAVSRVAGVSINTVTKLLVDAGAACEAFHDKTVRNVASKRVQCDEIWSFVGSKARNTPFAKKVSGQAGDVWTWTALDSDSKLILNWVAGDRSGATAKVFMQGVAERLANRVQLTTDGHKAYLLAVDAAFGADVDYAMLDKIYGESPDRGPAKRYSPALCLGAQKKAIEGFPDPAHISTSHVERQNLTMRMSMRRFTRLTNGFSKKVDNHLDALALYFVYYNFCRIHKSLRVTPAMAAGITDELMDMSHIVKLIDDAEAAPKKRGPYKKKAA
jgi:IS1 family transposase